MEPPGRRSTGVTATTLDVPATAALDFDALYRQTRDDVYAYAATLLRDRAGAEDVTAQAFERAYRKRSRYDAGRGSPRAWLFGIARNAALAARREAVRRALGRLGARERELIALKYHAGLSNVELAAVLGVSATNAGTLLHRAMTKLRESLDA